VQSLVNRLQELKNKEEKLDQRGSAGVREGERKKRKKTEE